MRKLFKRFTLVTLIFCLLMSMFSGIIVNAAKTTKSKLSTISVSKNSSYEQVYIKLSKYNKKVSISKLSSPTRVALTFSNTDLNVIKTKTFKSKVTSANHKITYINNIKVGKYSKAKNTVRITLEMKKNYKYSTVKVSDGVKVRFSKIPTAAPTVKPVANPIATQQPNFSFVNAISNYFSFNEVGSFELQGVTIDSLLDKAKSSISPDRTSITISNLSFIPNSDSPIVVLSDETKTLDFENSVKIQNVNDGVINTVEYTYSPDGKLSSIKINCPVPMFYYIKNYSVENKAVIKIYTPNALNRNIVFLDPGHGGKDAGAESTFSGVTVKEKDVNLAIVNYLSTYLKNKGLNVAQSRTTDTYVTLQDRVAMANSMSAAVFLCVHNNSADSSSAKGTETLCYSINTTTPSNSYLLGQQIQSSIVNSLNRTSSTLDRGVKARPELYVLKNTSMPSALAEVAFISNSSDRNVVTNVTNQKTVAYAMGDALINFLFNK